MKTSEEGMSKAEIGWKLQFLHQMASQAANAQRKFLKKMKTVPPANIWINKKTDLLLIGGHFSVTWIEPQISHNIPSSQSLFQSRALTLFNSMKAEKVRKLQKKSLKASRGWFMRFKQRSCPHKVQVQGEAANVVEPRESYPGDLAQIMKFSLPSWRWLH